MTAFIIAVSIDERKKKTVKSWISWAYFQTVVRTPEIGRSVIDLIQYQT